MEVTTLDAKALDTGPKINAATKERIDKTVTAHFGNGKDIDIITPPKSLLFFVTSIRRMRLTNCFNNF